MDTIARIADLKRKLAARENHNEYKANCAEIRAEIARLEASLAPSNPDE